MDYRKTVIRLAKTKKILLRDLALKVDYKKSFRFMRTFSKSPQKSVAEALEIREEIFLLEALRDSPNLSKSIRSKIVEILTELEN